MKVSQTERRPSQSASLGAVSLSDKPAVSQSAFWQFGAGGAPEVPDLLLNH
jgi:hypothetical protein